MKKESLIDKIKFVWFQVRPFFLKMLLLLHLFEEEKTLVNVGFLLTAMIWEWFSDKWVFNVNRNIISRSITLNMKAYEIAPNTLKCNILFNTTLQTLMFSYFRISQWLRDFIMNIHYYSINTQKKLLPVSRSS